MGDEPYGNDLKLRLHEHDPRSDSSLIFNFCQSTTGNMTESPGPTSVPSLPIETTRLPLPIQEPSKSLYSSVVSVGLWVSVLLTLVSPGSRAYARPI